MKTIVAALLVAAAQAGAAVPASEVCVENAAGFELSWYLKEVDTGEKSESTSRYPVYRTECVSIAEALPGVRDNETILPHVKAYGAPYAYPVESAVLYDAYGPRATFTCTGATAGFTCELTASESIVDVIEKTVIKEVQVPSGANLLGQGVSALLLAASLFAWVQ